MGEKGNRMSIRNVEGKLLGVIGKVRNGYRVLDSGMLNNSNV